VPELALYSMAVCPFAQRTRILLAFKGVECELHELDRNELSSAEYLALNPLGQVPVIVHKGRVLNESSVINEYLEEVFPAPAAFPLDPYRKAIARIAIDSCNHSFVPALYRLLMNRNRAQHAELTENALATWRWANDFLMRYNPDGTWLWDDFGMADLSYAPFFQRYCLNAYYRHFDVPHELERVLRWRDALLAHPLAQVTGMPEEDYIKLYEDYALGYGNGEIPPGRERSSFDRTVPLAERTLPPRPPRERDGI
jgi:glutathione S-transferase